MTRIITITSGKGGVGKTTITANIGTSLALMGKMVCLIDADFGLRNLDIPLGLTNRVVFDIGDYLEGSCHLQQLIIRDKLLPNLSFIAGNKDSNIYSQPIDFQEIIAHIAKDYDYVLIDSPAGIEGGFLHSVSTANEAIVVTTPHRTSIQDADRIVGILSEMMPSEPQLVINMVKNNDFETSAYITQTLQLQVLGIIQQDTEVAHSIIQGSPISLHPQFESGLRFRHIARNLKNNESKPFIPINKLDEENRSYSFSKWNIFKKSITSIGSK